MKIYFNNTHIDIQPDDNAYRSRQIMGEDALYLSFEHQGYLDIPVGAYCNFDGTTYYLLKPENFTKNGTRRFSYELTLESDSGRLSLYRFKNTVDGRIKFELASTPREYIEMIVANMNLRNSGWSVGQCIESKEKLIAFNANTIAEALDMVAKEYDTEWFIEGKKIGLGKIRKNESEILELSYGKGNGFVPGLGRSNYDNSFAFDVLYVQGGNRNIDYSKYGSKSLHLPKSQTIRYDGAHFEGEDGFNLEHSRQYITDAEGLTIRRNDKALTTLAPEDCYSDEESYPKREGIVSEWITYDADKNLYDFVDSSIPSDLNYNDVMIEDETMTVIFQTGMLAGREFDLQSYDHATRRFEIVPAEIDGQIMPNDIFKAEVGDEYAIFGCTLPDAYICNNATKTGAEWDMFKQAVSYMYENETPRFTFSGVLDGRWAAENWSSISSMLVLCGVVRFSDSQFLVDGEDIRIIGIKQYLNKQHYPEIELSNVTVSSSISTELNEYKAEPVLREASINQSVMYTKRRWRDLKETQMMLENAFTHFSGAIAPVTVQTMQMLVGDESLQFRFVTGKTSPISVDTSFLVSFDSASKQLIVSGGLAGGAMILQHMTLGVGTLSSSHDTSEFSFWNIPKFVSPALADTDAAYYVYAKVTRNGSNGDIVLSKTAISMEQVSGFYHLLLGILNSEYDGSRSFAPLFGYTEILPGRVTTDRVCSADGVNYFDLVTGEFTMALNNNSQYIRFDATNGVQIKGKLTIGAGSAGIENLAGYTERQSAIDDAIKKVADDLSDYEDVVELAIQDLQGQIDDAITSWYLDGVPTLSTAPASEWGTDELKRQHIGDLYYDKLTGFAYRFLLDGSTYKWVQIQDEAISEALAKAAQAQDTANGKRTNYFGENAPTGVTLSIGDMWSNGDELKIWNGSEWVDSNTYASQAALDGLSDSFDKITADIKAEMSEMSEAISRMNDDTVFDNDEKSYIRTLWENINGKASLLEIGAGTYMQTRQLAEDCGADIGFAAKLKFDGQALPFNGEEITFWVIGLSQLEGAFYSLRDYLRDMNLYLSQGTDGFDRERLADLFTTYYKAEQALVSYSANCYAESYCDNTLQSFVDGAYKKDLATIKTQMDGKAETFYQTDDPSGNWDTDTKREEHLGDIWMNTTPDANGNTHTYIYRKKDGEYGWEEVNGVPTEVFDMADGKAAIYTSKPSAYKKNDMWILEAAYKLSGVNYSAGTIVVAKNDSTASGWDAADWAKRDKYTDDTALETFLAGYTGTLKTIRDQIDKKAETWYQDSDPSSAWTDNATKKEHVGDLWMDTRSGQGKKTYIYQNTGTDESPNYQWVAQDVPTEVFDKIDGKAAIYTSKPSAYKKNDMWILEAAYKLSGVNYSAGTIVVAKNDSTASGWDAADWAKRDKYTDDTALETFLAGYTGTLKTIRDQIDKKAETWYQDSDPSSAWTDNATKKEHVGDLWMDTRSGQGKKTYIYQNTGTDESPNYQWVAQDVPTEVFDKIDGKAAIYTAWNAWVVSGVSQLHVKDIFIPSADVKQGNVTYMKNAFYRCASISPVAFEELKYTDDAALTLWLKNTYAPFVDTIKTQVDAKSDTFVQSTDPASAWTTNESKELHVGDMWLNTAKTTVAGVGSLMTAIYTKAGNTYEWSQSDIPSALFDQVDGKSSVWIAKPTNGYHARDLWILERAYVLNGTAYRQGTILTAVHTRSTFEAADWQKRDAYIDDYDLGDALKDIESEISNMNALLSDINDDSVLDVTEKGYVRTLWEAVNGLSSLSHIGADGSYTQTKNIVDEVGATSELVGLTFNGKHLYIGNDGQDELEFWYSGVSELDAAYYSLREYLIDANLYSDVVKRSFNRETMAALFTRYYDAVQVLLNRASMKYTDDSIEHVQGKLDIWASDGYISAVEKRGLLTILQGEERYSESLANKGSKYASNADDATAEQKAVYTLIDSYEQATISFKSALGYYTNSSAWEDNIKIEESGPYAWSYITNYYVARMNLEKAIDAAVKKATDDFAYLTEALGDGASTEVGDGVVLSQVIGVKEKGTTNVVAGMNGSASIPSLYDEDNGRLMIWAGSTKVSAAKDAVFQVWENGTLVAKQGHLEDLIIKRASNPFAPQSSSFTAVNDDTIYTCASGNPGEVTIDGHMHITMDWTAASNGRRVVVVGSVKFLPHATAPNTHMYIVNGRRVTTFNTSYEMTELIGMGVGGSFYWIVANRQIVFCGRNYGRDLRALAFGHVTGGTSYVSLKYECAVQNSAVSPSIADADRMFVTRVGTGAYRLWMPNDWFVSSEAIFCMVCGRGRDLGSEGVSAIFANVDSYGSGSCPENSNATMYYVDIRTADDASPNDGSFNFILYNTYAWHD